MRFVLFDRILELEKGKSARLLKNVTQSEDFFIDHFPGYPILPGSIIIGSFEQGSEILLGASLDFSLQPVLKSVSRASFKHLVMPGDQMELVLTLESVAPARVTALARVNGKTVADATIEFILETPKNEEAMRACDRLKRLYELLTRNPLEKIWGLWEQ